MQSVNTCKFEILMCNLTIKINQIKLIMIVNSHSVRLLLLFLDYHNKKAEGRKGGRGDGAQKARQPGQITELYASNFVRIVKQVTMQISYPHVFAFLVISSCAPL